ncbi:YwqG family protein [Streptomyces sp. NBC_01310]|uniref:DUF1963 domain-containing protein n=1 Tax=unclassified Streptomyces TaxID=2593676 RepID=UPI002DD9E171|nr:DUF1963 domain-containing protein [Streptomyces sp. NBC_01294]WRZ59918.1 YwqG family protein [Streptomyces sp. NBC_01294]WSJ58473.1 YwqG family protein [Streptomyces sp. NBC_01310]
MTTLLLDGGPVAPDAPVTRTGGVPLAPAGTAWPACAACAGPLQFLAQILLGDLPGTTAPTPGVLALFMCANRPGQCEQWSPTAGGNLALLLPADRLEPVPAPDADEDLLGLGAVRAAVPAATAPTSATVLGRLGGTPAWLQYDETPHCPACARPMDFTAELAEGPDPVTAMNFGSGRAYAHTCTPCGRATLLWQC